MKPMLANIAPVMMREPLQMTSPAPAETSSLAKVEVKGSAAAKDGASPEILKAAREFEAIFLRTLLGSLEKTTQLGAKGALSGGQSAYGSMVVSSMADSLSSAGGIGLSDVIAKALTARTSTPPDKSK